MDSRRLDLLNKTVDYIIPKEKMETHRFNTLNQFVNNTAPLQYHKSEVQKICGLLAVGQVVGHDVCRANILLLEAEDHSNLHRATMIRWRDRWSVNEVLHRNRPAREMDQPDTRGNIILYHPSNVRLCLLLLYGYLHGIRRVVAPSCAHCRDCSVLLKQ